MSEEVAEVTYRGNPLLTFSGPDAEEQAWRHVMRKELDQDPNASLYDVNVTVVSYDS